MMALSGKSAISMQKNHPNRKSSGSELISGERGESEGAIVNAMIEGSCDKIVKSSEELLGTISGLF
jgi:hypothetical protein